MADSDTTPLPPEYERHANGKPAAFDTTHWSVVLQAGGENSTLTHAALEKLCQTYWYPLYAFIRRRGLGPHDAEDLTQAYFAHLLERDALKTVAREKGKFRSFLLASLTNFLNNERDKQKTLKRGGRVHIISWDEAKAEDQYQHEPADHVTPENLFERRWAFTVFEQSLERLKQEHQGQSKQPLFNKLHPYLTREAEPGFLSNVSAELKLTEGAVKVALHRLRRRFGELLRSQVAYTVADPELVEEEIRHLLTAISR
jgi:RNA polymerase sigma-70 factor (ECF subfamily)